MSKGEPEKEPEQVVFGLHNVAIEPIGEFNNYSIASNITNAFAVGEIGAQDDFFLVGAEPDGESNYPLLTGTILDSEGNVLFRLVRNILVFNPGHCSRVFGNHIGYEIHDTADHLIFRVETRFEQHKGMAHPCWVTKLAGRFFDKNRRLAFLASTGGGDERIEGHTKAVFGFSGQSFTAGTGYSEQELRFLAVVLKSRCRIHQPIQGVLEGQQIHLDGKALIDASLRNCDIQIESGDFVLMGHTAMSGCKVYIDGPAANIYGLMKEVEQSAGRAPPS